MIFNLKYILFFVLNITLVEQIKTPEFMNKKESVQTLYPIIEINNYKFVNSNTNLEDKSDDSANDDLLS